MRDSDRLCAARVFHAVFRVENLNHLIGVRKRFVGVTNRSPEVPEFSEDPDEVALDQREITNGQQPLLPELNRVVHHCELNPDHERCLDGLDELTEPPGGHTCLMKSPCHLCVLFVLVLMGSEEFHVHRVGERVRERSCCLRVDGGLLVVVLGLPECVCDV